MYELYMNVRGEPPMRFAKQLPAPPSLSEAEAAKTLETGVDRIDEFVYAMTGSHREPGSQYVVVRDGLIVAVEGLTTRKLIWTS